VFRGTHVDHPAVTMHEARSVHLAADRPVWMIGDGELLGRLPAHVSVEPASLAVIVGPGVTERLSQPA
jgi:diacylglycerol kinase (ATP)